MGDCASRPNESEIEEHLLQSNPKNDSYFRYIPRIDFFSKEIAEETNVTNLEQKINFLIKMKKGCQYKKENIIQGSQAVPELNIEIQKGHNLYKNNNCFSQSKPYVKISLEPNGPIVETHESDSYKPYWYRFIQFRNTMWSFESIDFKVLLKRNMREDELLGNYTLKLDNLDDQLLKEGWFDLITDDSINKKCMLCLRIQMIKDERLLLDRLMDKCDEIILMARYKIEQIHNSRYNSDSN
ncbi:unnamed protein product [Blepharisma stoltei]|uniref:C2 domain-containing protein n=1 Tax=Blepharisma stoltei TaxID=1481888 RepID=A0AAU9KEJ5_9CILI|nr:unnamed protein product [Blepharisma stoltei]